MDKKRTPHRKAHPYKPDHIETYHPTAEYTLLAYMLEVLQPRSRTEIKSLLAHSHVTVNGTPVRQFDMQILPGDELVINFSRPFLTITSPLCKLLWEDDDLVVVEKKSGLLTVSAGRRREKTAQQIVDEYVYGRDGRSHAYVCHRLDQFTSGILLFAKNGRVQEMLRDSWAHYVVERRYMALVEGSPNPPEGEVKSYLVEGSDMKVYSTDDPERGKLAITRYASVRSASGFSQMDIQLLTGRKNQIRVHMADIGCPIVGDRKYGARTSPFGRLMLHNYALQFIHPITHENLRFELPLPTGFTL